MGKLKEHIIDWLLEIEEESTASFLADCIFNQIYIDTMFSMDSDVETAIYEVEVNVPLKVYKKINEFAYEISATESALAESGRANGIYVREVKWIPYLKSQRKKQMDEKTEKIIKIFNQEYVNRQIRLMNSSIKNNPHLAIGVSKELIETCCKYILTDAKIDINRDWDLPKLVKETNKQINLMPFKVDNIELAKSSIAKILGGFSNIVHGITELRNSYGTGHGHLPSFKSLDEVYANLAVSSSSELALFYLRLRQVKIESEIIN